MRVFLTAMVILLVLLLIFAVQNPGSTDVTFITFSATAPLLLIILVSALVGLLLGVAIMAPGSLRRATRLRRLDSEIKALEERSADVQTKEARMSETATEADDAPTRWRPRATGKTRSTSTTTPDDAQTPTDADAATPDTAVKTAAETPAQTTTRVGAEHTPRRP